MSSIGAARALLFFALLCFLFCPLAAGGRYGMLSYPNYAPPDKGLKHPNLRLLAAASEEAGADLRVVVSARERPSGNSLSPPEQ